MNSNLPRRIKRIQDLLGDECKLSLILQEAAARIA